MSLTKAKQTCLKQFWKEKIKNLLIFWPITLFLWWVVFVILKKFINYLRLSLANGKTCISISYYTSKPKSLEFLTVLVRVSMAMNRHHYHSNSYKKCSDIGWLTYSVKGSVHYYHERGHGSMYVDVVLELSVLYFAGNKKTVYSLGDTEHIKFQIPIPQWQNFI